MLNHQWINTTASIIGIFLAGYALSETQGKADMPVQTDDPVLEGNDAPAPAAPSAASAVGSFGQWITVGGEQTATTDGFARVSSGGNNPAIGVQIQVKDANGKWKTVVRSPTVYSTVIAPIPKGTTWQGVAMERGGQLTVSWMPAH